MLGNIFLTQLKSIHSKYQESCAIVYQLLKNLVFRLLHLILHKDWQFIIYIEKYIWAKVMEEINKLISSPHLRKQVLDISLESFELFSYIEIDRKHQKYALFTQFLICICMNNSEIIINNPDTNNLYDIPLLCNNMTESPLLENRITFQHNRALIVVMTLGILCYAQNKCFNIIQRVNIQFAFVNNVFKRFVELFY